MRKRFTKVLAIALTIAMLVSVAFVGVTANAEVPNLLLWEDFTRTNPMAGFADWYAIVTDGSGGGEEFELAVPLTAWLRTQLDVEVFDWTFPFMASWNRQLWWDYATAWSNGWVPMWLAETENGANPALWTNDQQIAWLTGQVNAGSGNPIFDSFWAWGVNNQSGAINAWVTQAWPLLTYGGVILPPLSEYRALRPQLRDALAAEEWVLGFFPQVDFWDYNIFDAELTFTEGHIGWGGNTTSLNSLRGWLLSPGGWGQYEISNAWLDMWHDAGGVLDYTDFIAAFEIAYPNSRIAFEQAGLDLMAAFPGMWDTNPLAFSNDPADYVDLIDTLNNIWSEIVDTAGLEATVMPGWRSLEQGWYDEWLAAQNGNGNGPDFEAIFRAARPVNGAILGTFQAFLANVEFGPEFTDINTGSTGWNGAWQNAPTVRIPTVAMEYGDLEVSEFVVTHSGALNNTAATRTFDPAGVLGDFMNDNGTGFHGVGFQDGELWFSATLQYNGSGLPANNAHAMLSFRNPRHHNNSSMLAVGIPGILWGDGTPRSASQGYWWTRAVQFEGGAGGNRNLENPYPDNWMIDQGNYGARMWYQGTFHEGAPLVQNQTMLVVVRMELTELRLHTANYDGDPRSVWNGSGMTRWLSNTLGGIITLIEDENITAHNQYWAAPITSLFGTSGNIGETITTLFDGNWPYAGVEGATTAALTQLVEEEMAEAVALFADRIPGYAEMSLSEKLAALLNVINRRGTDVVTIYINPTVDSETGMPTAPANQMEVFEFAPTWEGNSWSNNKFFFDAVQLSAHGGNTYFGDMRFGTTFASVVPGMVDAPVESEAGIIVEDDYVIGLRYLPLGNVHDNLTVIIAVFNSDEEIAYSRFFNANMSATAEGDYRFIDLTSAGISADVTSGQILRAFVWNDFLGVSPASARLTTP